MWAYFFQCFRYNANPDTFQKLHRVTRGVGKVERRIWEADETGL